MRREVADAVVSELRRAALTCRRHALAYLEEHFTDRIAEIETMADPVEVGVTNLGPVPPGKSFIEATRDAVPQRKHDMDPWQPSRRLTVCDTAREIWRRAHYMPTAPDALAAEAERFKLLAGAVNDYGKRMDGRMRELKDQLREARTWIMTYVAELEGAAGVFEKRNPGAADTMVRRAEHLRDMVDDWNV